jgi:hypothetical protein
MEKPVNMGAKMFDEGCGTQTSNPFISQVFFIELSKCDIVVQILYNKKLYNL